MNLNILIVTTKGFGTRSKLHEDIKRLMDGNNLEVTITTLHKRLKPVIRNNRITEDWFEKNITAYAKRHNYNFVLFHFSEKEGKTWGIDSNLRGSSFLDDDFYGEGWVCADETSTVTFLDGTSRNKYVKVVAHEIAHELKNQGITPLEIHDFDYKNDINNIEEFYRLVNKRSVIDVLMAQAVALKERIRQII